MRYCCQFFSVRTGSCGICSIVLNRNSLLLILAARHEMNVDVSTQAQHTIDD
jgi:hypothetical protein